MRKLILGLLPILMLFTGCATPTRDYWNQRVGKITYDQVVAEFGQPAKESKLAGGNRIATWLVRPGMPGYIQVAPAPTAAPTITSPSFQSPPVVNPSTVSIPAQPDQYVRLTFSPNGKLIAWAPESEFQKPSSTTDAPVK
jgi:hypothetical protein